MRKNKAFTLVEILLSITIFVVIAVSLYSVFNTGMFSYRRIKGGVSVYQTARGVFNRIGLDLRNSFAFSEEETKFEGNNKEITFFTLVSGPYSNVSYSLQEDRLMRLCKKGPESIKEDYLLEPSIIAKKIKDLQFSYAFLTGDENIYDWQNVWAEEETEKDQMPLAVKIRLVLEEESSKQKNEVELERIVFLPCRKTIQ